MSERELLARHVAGDDAAFTELTKRCAPMLRNVLHRILTNNPASVDDVLQRTLWKIHHGASTFSAPHRFGPWARMIARHEAINELRRSRRYDQVFSPWPEIVSEETGLRTPVEFRDEKHTPADLTMEQQEQLRLGKQLVQRITRIYRQVFLMREVQGLTYDEIAERLRLPIGTVKSRLHRARLELGALRACA